MGIQDGVVTVAIQDSQVSRGDPRVTAVFQATLACKVLQDILVMQAWMAFLVHQVIVANQVRQVSLATREFQGTAVRKARRGCRV